MGGDGERSERELRVVIAVADDGGRHVERRELMDLAVAHAPVGLQEAGEAEGSIEAAHGDARARIDNTPRIASRNELSICAACRRGSRCTPHFKALRVSVIFVIAVKR